MARVSDGIRRQLLHLSERNRRFIDGLIQQEVTDGRGSLTYVSRGDIADNDGLTLEDWEAWFKDYDRSQPMAIIHFTNFRYCK